MNKSIFSTLTIIMSALFFFATPTSAQEQYFVATDGSDENLGTITSPFKTIEHAINRSSPGHTIYVREGVYEELIELENLPSEPNKWLTIGSYENEKVILDGSNVEDRVVGIKIENSKNIRISGFEIRNISTDDRDEYPAGILIRGESSNIQIKNNDIHHIAHYHQEGNAHGILVYGNTASPIEHIMIQNNSLHDLTLGRSESLTFSGNVTNFLINKNYLYNNNNIGIDIAGHYGACIEVGCIDIARNGIISNNHVTNQSSSTNIAYEGERSAAGIYVDGGQNITIFNNYVSHNDFGISLASENTDKAASNLIVLGNTITKNVKAGLVIGGSSDDNGGVAQVTIKQNSFTYNDIEKKGYREVTLQHHLNNVTFKQNTYSVCSFTNYINYAEQPNESVTFSQEKVRPFPFSCMH